MKNPMGNMDNLLKRISQQHRQLQDRLVFYINNYFQILSVCEVFCRARTQAAVGSAH